MGEFRERLEAARREKKSAVCVGLDPRLDQVPPALRGLPPGQAILAFNRQIIDATADVAIAVKPQSAFYETFGADGVSALIETVHYARSRGLIVLLDGKRNDIGSTAEAYAHAYLHPDGPFQADALTVNGYLGTEGMEPFLKVARRHGKGVFALVRTSNPGSSELQDRVLVTGETVYETMAKLVDSWDCEAVVGATYPQQAARARTLMPRAWVLVPGYGAQGGTASDAAVSFRADGSGALVSNSRGIVFAADPRAAAIEMRDALNEALATGAPSP